MKFENNFSSLEPSRKLKYLGVKQESLFYHVQLDQEKEDAEYYGERYRIYRKDQLGAVYDCWSAFTVAELGEMLPDGYQSYRRSGLNPQHPELWRCEEDAYSTCEAGRYANTEADARAKMLIYLIEQGIVKP